jgi:peptidoglycan/LPS O-acetylase OafA/YrhL
MRGLANLALRDCPWRAALAAVCAIAAGKSGPMAVDRYYEQSDYIAPTVLAVFALALAWRATRSSVRWDRVLGYPVLGLLALIVVFMVLDRAR